MPKKITIAGTGLESFKIVYGENPGAALELRKYLEIASGIKLPVIHDCEKAEHEIRVGKTNRVCRLCSYDGLSEDGFAIKTAGGNLIIRGNNARADMYGVYEFLEKFVGFRFIADSVNFLKGGDVELEDGLRRTFNPPYEYRQLDWVCAQGEDFKLKNGINYTDFNWTGFVHTLASLTGKGDQTTQPCLSDPDNLKIVIKNVRRLLDENPGCRIISVSQNDNTNYCKCPKCAASDAEEGSPAGTLLKFVNAVADDIRDDYPDVSIETLAYQYTRKAPLITKPRDNVIIRLCSIECCFSHPLGDMGCEVNAAFKHDIEEWGKISKRLYIWDYVTNFSHYIPPFPNFRVLLDNMKFFKDNHVVGMYPEGNYQAASGEFGELRAYLLGRAMWDPDMTSDEYFAYMDDFLAGYYGAGWSSVRAFIDFTLEKSAPRHFNIWTKPFDIISREEYLENEEKLDALWDDAEAKADSAQKARVKRSRLQWTYIKLMLHPDEKAGKTFFDTVEALGVRWNEWFGFKSDPDFTLPANEWIKR